MRFEHIIKHGLHFVRFRPNRMDEQRLIGSFAISVDSGFDGQQLICFYCSNQTKARGRQWFGRKGSDATPLHCRRYL